MSDDTMIGQGTRLMSISIPEPGDSLAIRRLEYRETLGRLFSATAELMSRDPEVDLNALIGKPVSITVRTNGGFRYINGHISELRRVGVPSQTDYNAYRAVIVPRVWFLSRRSDCKIFQEKTIPEIIKSVIEDHQMGTVDISELTGDYQPRPFVVQYKETHLNFITRLMEEEGIYLRFDHLDSGELKAFLCDASPTAESVEGYETVYFHEGGAEGVPEDRITDWTVHRKAMPRKYVVKDFDFAAPTRQVAGERENASDHFEVGAEIFDYPLPYADVDGPARYAQVRAEELEAQYELHGGMSNVRGLVCGRKFTLAGYPGEGVNGDYLVCMAVMTVSNGEFGSSSAGDSGESFACQFSCIPLAKPYRLGRNTEKPTIPGPQTAIVVGAAGEEIYTDPDTACCVKVKFHWDRWAAADETASCWVRVSQPWAGNGYGGQFMPRVGQEVIVQFIDGDPDRPIVTGRVFNGDNKGIFNTENKTRSGLVTNTSTGGGGANMVIFEDKAGEEQLILGATKDMHIYVHNDMLMEVDNNVGWILGTNWSTTVGGNHHAAVAGDYVLKVDGDTGTDHAGDRLVNVGGAEHLTVGGDQMTDVGGASNLKVGGDLAIEAGGKVTFKCSDFVVKASGNVAIEGGSEVHVKSGGKVVVEGSSNVSVKVGGNYVVCDASGVAINGTMVKINSGGSAQSGAGASPLSPAAPAAPPAPEAPEAKERWQPGQVETPAENTPPELQSTDMGMQAPQSPAAEALEEAAEEGTPFCEECERARQEQAAAGGASSGASGGSGGATGSGGGASSGASGGTGGAGGSGGGASSGASGGTGGATGSGGGASSGASGGTGGTGGSGGGASSGASGGSSGSW